MFALKGPGNIWGPSSVDSNSNLNSVTLSAKWLYKVFPRMVIIVQVVLSQIQQKVL